MTGRWMVGVLAALALASGALGCGINIGGGSDTGASDSGEEDTAAQEQEVEDAVRAYGDARGADTCEFVTDEYIDSRGGISRCARNFEDSTPTRYRVQSVNLSGSKATVKGKNLTSGGNVSLDVVLEDGEWKVDPR